MNDSKKTKRELLEEISSLRQRLAQVIPDGASQAGAGIDPARLQALYDLAPDMYLTVAPHGEMLSVNEFGARHLGYDTSELLGNHVSMLVHLEDRHVVDEQLRELLTSSEQYGELEFRKVRKDGTVLRVQERIRVLRDVQGQATEMLVVCRDITAQYDAAAASRETRSLLSKAQEVANIGSWEWNVGEQRAIWSDQLFKIFGVEPGHCGGSIAGYIDRFVHPDDHDRMRRYWVELFAGRTVRAMQYRAVRPNGTVRTVIGQGEAICDAEGDVLKIVGTVQDITERKLAEDALQETETRLRLLLAQMPALLWTTDPDLRITSCVGSIRDAIGVDGERALGRTLFELFDSPSDDDVRLAHQQAIQGRSVSYEQAVADRTLQVHVEPLRGPDHVVTGVIGVAVDVTERRRAETERSALENQLRQSQKMEALGVLAGGIAHDFNNILATIVGFTELVLDRLPGGSREAQYSGEVLVAASRAERLVDQILTFSRPSDATLQFVELHTVVAESLGLLRASLPTTITIVDHIEAIRNAVRADPNQVHQVILNLAMNAAQAMRGGGQLDIILKPYTAPAPVTTPFGEIPAGDFAELTVRDTGIGMTNDTLQCIFDPFFTTKNVGEGTGLGMAVVYGILRSHGGAVNVESTVGVGTTVSVYLPLCAQAAIVDGPEDLSAPEGTERILLIDDEWPVVEVGRLTLQGLGYEVVPRTDSAQALEEFRANPAGFDLVITDQTMPRLTGLQISEQVRDIRPDVPVVLVSGYTETLSPSELRKAGVTEVVKKPMRRRELAQALRRALNPTRDASTPQV